MLKARVLLGLGLAGLAASGCGLKGPLYLPEKSEVTIRPAPKPATEPAATGEDEVQPEPAATPAPPPQDPPSGSDRG